jgi:hypothetical protein
MARESREEKNDEEEVVETVGCGGSIRSRFNPSLTIALTA